MGVVIDLYCAMRRDWSFAAAEVEGEGEKDSESGDEVCGRYGEVEEGVRGPSSSEGLSESIALKISSDRVTVTSTRPLLGKRLTNQSPGHYQIIGRMLSLKILC